MAGRGREIRWFHTPLRPDYKGSERSEALRFYKTFLLTRHPTSVISGSPFREIVLRTAERPPGDHVTRARVLPFFTDERFGSCSNSGHRSGRGEFSHWTGADDDDEEKPTAIRTAWALEWQRRHRIRKRKESSVQHNTNTARSRRWPAGFG